MFKGRCQGCFKIFKKSDIECRIDLLNSPFPICPYCGCKVTFGHRYDDKTGKQIVIRNGKEVLLDVKY